MDYDVAPIRAHSLTDYAAYKAFYRFNLFVRQPYILPIYLVIPAVFSYFFYKGQDDSLISAVCFFVLMCGVLIFSLIRGAKAGYRQYRKLSPNGIDFTFHGNGFNTASQGDASSSSGAYSYATLSKVYETGSAFYLFLPNRQAFLVEKEGIAGGTAEELAELLKSRVGSEKYRQTRGASRPAQTAAFHPSYVAEQGRAEQDHAQNNADEALLPSYVVKKHKRPQESDRFTHCDAAPITAHSSYDATAYRRFQLFHSFGRNRFLPFLMVVFLIGAIWGFTSGSQNITVYLMSCFYLLLDGLLIFGPLNGAKQAYHNGSKLHPNGIDFTFCSNAFEVNNTGSDSASGSNRLTYALLDKVYETRTTFYLYPVSGQAYLVEKRGVADNRAQELSLMLEAKVGRKKYKYR